jgi:hypothetical protein
MGSVKTTVVVLLGANFIGCSSIEEFLHTPTGRFDLYGCRDLAGVLQASRKREAELQELIQRAGTDASGRAAAYVIYHNEYAQSRAYQKHAAEVMQKKNCGSESQWSSERAVR